jgi:hypothetical protein
MREETLVIILWQGQHRDPGLMALDLDGGQHDDEAYGLRICHATGSMTTNRAPFVWSPGTRSSAHTLPL